MPVLVFRNGVYLTAGLDYTITAALITLTAQPSDGADEWTIVFWRQ
jgi:hypothetical protein